LRKEVETAKKGGAGPSTGGSAGSSAEVAALKQKNADLEKAARVLADQVTQLCDKAEKAQELEDTVNKLDSENEQLATDIKNLEAELDARETEVENVLSDNDQLVLKLESLGIKVDFTDKGIAFTENDGSKAAPSRAAPPAKAAPAGAKPAALAAPAPAARNRTSSKAAEEAAAKGDMKSLLSMSVDDLLG